MANAFTHCGCSKPSENKDVIKFDTPNSTKVPLKLDDLDWAKLNLPKSKSNHKCCNKQNLSYTVDCKCEMKNRDKYKHEDLDLSEYIHNLPAVKICSSLTETYTLMHYEKYQQGGVTEKVFQGTLKEIGKEFPIDYWGSIGSVEDFVKVYNAENAGTPYYKRLVIVNKVRTHFDKETPRNLESHELAESKYCYRFSYDEQPFMKEPKSQFCLVTDEQINQRLYH